MKKITKDYFQKGLDIAEITENHFADYLKEQEWDKLFITGGDFPEYDIEATKDGLDIRVEVKTASASEKYKSYFIECYQSGLKSGLSISTADFWVFYDERGEIRGIRSDKLKDYIKNKNLPLKPTSYTSYGEKVSAHGYVVPFSIFKLITTHNIKIENNA